MPDLSWSTTALSALLNKRTPQFVYRLGFDNARVDRPAAGGLRVRLLGRCGGEMKFY